MKGNCQACGVYGIMDRAHLKTRGSGAGWNDDEWILLCRAHHIQQGAIGWFSFCFKFPKVGYEIEKRGWYFEEIFGVMKLLKVKK